MLPHTLLKGNSYEFSFLIGVSTLFQAREVDILTSGVHMHGGACSLLIFLFFFLPISPLGINEVFPILSAMPICVHRFHQQNISRLMANTTAFQTKAPLKKKKKKTQNGCF